MAGPLKNARHERFTQALAAGQSAHKAYIDAGYRPCRQNAARLTTKEDIRARLAELQGEIATATKVTVESICKELDAANEVAKAKGQAAAMVSASALRAKLAGLMTDKLEIGAPGAFEKCASVAEIVDELLSYDCDQFHPATEEDRKGLAALYQRHFAEVEEFIAGIKARPIPPEISYKARRIEYRRHGNGKSQH
jgi:hypothetical protein